MRGTIRSKLNLVMTALLIASVLASMGAALPGRADASSTSWREKGWKQGWGPAEFARLKQQDPAKYAGWRWEWGPRDYTPENWPGAYVLFEGKRYTPAESRKRIKGTVHCSDKLMPQITCFRSAAQFFRFIGLPCPQPVTCADLWMSRGCKPKPNPDIRLVTEREKARILARHERSQQRAGGRTSATAVEVQNATTWAVLYDGYNYACGSAGCRSLTGHYPDLRNHPSGNFNDKTSSLKRYTSNLGKFYYGINYEPWWVSTYVDIPDLRNYYGDNRDNHFSSATHCAC